MNHLFRFTCTSLLLMAFIVGCASTKTIDVWKAEGYSDRLHDVLVIAVAREGFIREQFENVLTNQLADHGVRAVPSYKVLPQADKETTKQDVLAAVQKAGVDQVLIARSINKEEITNHQTGGMYFAATAVYSDGWYSFYTGSFAYRQQDYDTTTFTVATNLFEVASKKPVWSSVAQVKVEGTKRQGAVNRLVPLILEELTASKLIE